MKENDQLPYLPLKVLIIIISYMEKRDVDDWKKFRLVSRKFLHAALNELSFKRINLEDYTTPWLPTPTWHKVKRYCCKARNPHDVFVEAARHLQKEGITFVPIEKLRASASKGHKPEIFSRIYGCSSGY